MRNRNLAAVLMMFLGMVVTLPAVAGTYADALSICFADNTTGKERKELVKWTFASLSAHPDIRSMSNVTDQMRKKISQSVGELLTRLVSEDCSEQVLAVVDKEGDESLKAAFGSFGRIAMRELMNDPSVNAEMGAFANYIDRDKINAISTKR